MLAKIIGAILLVVGIGLALKLLFHVLGFFLAALGALLSVALVGGLLYFGWRLLNR